MLSPIIWAVSLLATGTAGIAFFRRHRIRGRHLYQQHLERALADGILTDDEARELASVREQRDLSAAEVRMVAVSLYRRALMDAVADARITEQEDETLRRMKEQLGLSDADLAADVAQLQRIRVFAGVERGELPRIDSPEPLANGEICHWVVQGTIGDPLATPGRRSELHAISFEVKEASTFSASGSRSPLRSSWEMLPSDIGFAIITNRRTIFRGARRTVSVPHIKLRRVDLYQDGIALNETEPPCVSYLLVSDPELTAAILLSAAVQRQKELAGLTTRTA